MDIRKCSFIILGVLLLSCSKTMDNSRFDQKRLRVHEEVYPDAGFVMKFSYPDNLTIASRIDNCICIGENTVFYDKNEAAENDNTRQWCICVLDTSEYSIDYLISSWKSLYKGQVKEESDTVLIDDSKAFQISFISDTSYRQLIYLNRYSTLFEVINIDKDTEKDFESFYKSLRIEKYISK